MKEKKYLVMIEDDCEVMGNGRGNVLEHQFIPSLMLMNLAKKFDIKMTFMVDVAHQLTLKKYLHDPKVRIQSEVLF